MSVKKIYLIGVLLMLAVPLIWAYSGYSSWGYRSPLDYLDNEWVMFAIITLVFFAVIFYTINKSFDNNAVSGVIALGLSLLISMTLTRRGWLYGYTGNELGGWILIVVVLISVGFLVKFAQESFGAIGAIAVVAGAWVLLHGTNPYDVLPYEMMTDTVINLYEFLASWFGLILLLLIALGFTAAMERNDPLKKTLRSVSRIFRR